MDRQFPALSCSMDGSADQDRISLAHGEGARASRRLLLEFILPRLHASRRQAEVGNHPSEKDSIGAIIQDAAEIVTNQRQLAFCTDSHTITPLFFPGGDLGSLAIFGTVNDLAVSGAVPRWISLSLILEEGLKLSVLGAILDSCALAASQCQVEIVTGDTKVVPRGAVDAIFLNTSGIGEFYETPPPGPSSIQVGDRIIVSSSIGRHGTAVLGLRNGLKWSSGFCSDCRTVFPAIRALRSGLPSGIRCMRDATRGGVGAVLQEWARECQLSLQLNDSAIPVSAEVRGACELFGIDPLYLANEGTFVAVVAAEVASQAVGAIQKCPGFEDAAEIGDVHPRGISPVTTSRIGGRIRPLDEPTGAPLPRIC